MNCREERELPIGEQARSKPKPKCPKEPGYQCDDDATPNGKSSNGKRGKSKKRDVVNITSAHWDYLTKLKETVVSRGHECECGCEGNAFECTSVAAVRYRNLRHYIFEAYRRQVEKIASISYSEKSNSIGGYERIVSRDDAISRALQAMLQRIDTYDCHNPNGASFMTFIFLAISNSVIDEMRILSDFPNIVAPRKRMITNIRKNATAAANRTVTDEELLEFAKSRCDSDEFAELIVAYDDALSHKTTSNQSVGSGEGGEELHDNIEGACSGSELTLAYRPDNKSKRSAFNRYLTYVVDERSREVVALSYCSDLNASLISAVMGISQSMVSKLKKQGEEEIRKAILIERESQD